MSMIWTNEFIVAVRIARGRRAFLAPKTTVLSIFVWPSSSELQFNMKAAVT
jgi:hypothetical protein